MAYHIKIQLLVCSSSVRKISKMAPAYLRDYFFGGMITTGRSESINAFIKRFVSSHVAYVVQEIYQGNLYNNMVATLKPTNVKTKSPLELQDELTKASQYSIIQVEGNVFNVKYFERKKGTNRKVFWDGTTMTCSCKNFEFWGILCRHIFRVLLHKDCFKIPCAYLPLRWHYDRLQTIVNNQEVTRDDLMLEEEIEDIHNDISVCVNNVRCPPKAKKRDVPERSVTRVEKKWGNSKLKVVLYASIPDINEGASPISEKKQKKMAADIGLNPIFTLKF
ncbi:Protein FAR1-RELATED SEQUENCE 11 [Bienertia sinuspersici]